MWLRNVVLTNDRIYICEKGEVIELKNGRFRPAGKVPAGNVLIDGIGVGDVGNIVLRDRKLLSQDGILIVVVTLNRREKKIHLVLKLFQEVLFMFENQKNYLRMLHREYVKLLNKPFQGIHLIGQ